MLRGIHPLLGPEVLQALRALGHGDELVIADANFPAHSLGPRVIRLDGISATDAAEAILTHLPLDTFAPPAAWRMAVVGAPEEVPPICREFEALVGRFHTPATIAAIERFAFYERARTAALIVQTGERRLYGNLGLKTGVLLPA